MKNLTLSEFSVAFGTPITDKNLENLNEKIEKFDFRYSRLPQQDRDSLILSILKKIDEFSKVGAHRNEIWNNAWQKIADSYGNSQQLTDLFPSFISATNIIRLNGDYATPESTTFEKDWFCVFREWLFKTYLEPHESVYEFGCGSGYNLVALSEIYPSKKMYGLDWSKSAVDLIEKFSSTHNLNITGKVFDFFAPDQSFHLDKDSAVMTFCALEQTGDKWQDFVLWLIKQKPKIVINMEPIVDFYDTNSLFDYLAISYHQHRGYLSSYFPFLQQLEKEGKIKIEKHKRLGVGSLYHEGYNLIVWKPL